MKKCRETKEQAMPPAARDSRNDEYAEKDADGFVTKICD